MEVHSSPDLLLLCLCPSVTSTNPSTVTRFFFDFRLQVKQTPDKIIDITNKHKHKHKTRATLCHQLNNTPIFPNSLHITFTSSFQLTTQNFELNFSSQ